jgi:hypothetical protein
MLEPPYDLISCTWPRPIEQVDGCWTSEPEWAAPTMPHFPQPRWESVHGESCWTIDWREWFRGGLKFWQPQLGGEMRNFHIVSQLQINGNGTLVFWDDDGSIIRRNGEVIHADRTSHPPRRSEINVHAGDRLEVAQWQYYGGWTWGARLTPPDAAGQAPVDVLLPYLDAVERRLAHPNGPPLKMYFSGQTTIRTVVSLYSMILNGYSPAQVFVFGEYQWTAQSRKTFATLLPFAEIVSTELVLERIQSLGNTQLTELARQHFLVMKTCAGLLYPPTEYCLMDDDVFILDPVEDGLNAFQQHNLVFAPDADYGADYLAAWGTNRPRNERLRTGTLNAGLYWLRNSHDLRMLAAEMLRVPPTHQPNWQWEQGFIATQYENESFCALPPQRYFYPYFDGLPGGMLGYDYARNPCGFVSIHFGGLAEKPSNDVALMLVHEILGRNL